MMYCASIVYIIFFILCSLKIARLKVTDITVNSNTVDNQVTEYILKKFDKTRTLYIYDSTNEQQSVHQSVTPYIILDIKQDLRLLLNIWRYDTYIIHMETDLNQLHTFFSTLQSTPCYNSQANIIFINTYSSINLGSLFRLFWKYYFINVLVFFGNEVYTYQPISLGCKRIEPIYLASLHNLSTMVFMFNESNVMYFDNCRFRISAAPISPYVQLINNVPAGLEISIIKEVISRLHLNFEYLEHNHNNYGHKLANGSYTLMLKDLQEGRVDIVFGIIELVDDLAIDFDYTYPQCFAQMAFFVPFAKVVRPWKNLILIFQADVWLCLTVTLIVLIIAWYICSDYNLNHSFFNVINILLSAAPFRPKPRKLKLIYGCWIVCSFILTSCYQSRLVSFLFKPSYGFQISTLEDLSESNLRTGGYTHPGTPPLFAISDTPVIKSLERRFEICSLSGIECLNKLMYSNNYSFFKNTRTVIYNLKQSNKTAFMIEPTFLLYGTMYLAKGSPYKKRVNQIILAMHENGLISRLDVYRQIKPVKRGNVRQQVSLRHIMLALIILVLGLITAMLVFLLEVYMGRKK